MKTIRWFKIKLPIDAESLSKTFLDNPFSEEAGEGFIIKKSTRSEIIGSFVKTKKFIKKVESPRGEISTISGIEYFTIEFRFMLNNVNLLEIYSKPRTLLPFINKITQEVGIGFSITEIDIDIFNFLSVLEIEFGDMHIEKIVIENININNYALGQLTIVSDKDARESIKNYLLDGRDYTVKSIKARLTTQEFKGGLIEINRNSRITINDLPYKLFSKRYLQIYLEFIGCA
ncbi:MULTISPECIES: hypothetical protein [unclassified Psychrobacter]|uniref:hypothetical protein n=1 Tax=unclassified Psychrobacter TaxID=196806 RepID=UPI0025F0097F|nr:MULTISPECIES: hypothetical protein [unclassified Psychrobacter]